MRWQAMEASPARWSTTCAQKWVTGDNPDTVKELTGTGFRTKWERSTRYKSSAGHPVGCRKCKNSLPTRFELARPKASDNRIMLYSSLTR
nr:hypothetical protein CFP56_38830 [Quercus suber]